MAPRGLEFSPVWNWAASGVPDGDLAGTDVGVLGDEGDAEHLGEAQGGPAVDVGGLGRCPEHGVHGQRPHGKRDAQEGPAPSW